MKFLEKNLIFNINPIKHKKNESRKHFLMLPRFFTSFRMTLCVNRYIVPPKKRKSVISVVMVVSEKGI
jgi:hypothetical protein